MSYSSHLARIDDRIIRWIGIPAFGILVPHFTGLFGPLNASHFLYWAGALYFIFISWMIWHGNRWMLFKQRENMNWFSSPVRKLIILVAANVFYTAPVTISLIAGWYWMSGLGPVDWTVVRMVTLCNVICVLFVTHAYETVFLIKERQNDQLTFEQLERIKAEAELELLKSQIDPHFMFNSLNTLSYLIRHDQVRALQFNESLSDVYRYILMNKDHELVPLKEEVSFASSYFSLIHIRFGLGVHFQTDIPHEYLNHLMPPISLQLLVENAVKHNEFSETNPLIIHLSVTEKWILVKNNRLTKKVKDSSRIGLKNLNERYLFLLGKPVEVEHSPTEFIVKLPYLLSV